MGIPTIVRALLVVAATAGVLVGEPREVTSRSAGTPRATSSPELRDLPARVPQLGLVVYDIHALLQSSYTDLVRETSSIFTGMGVDTGWRRGGLGTVHGSGSLREIPVILLSEPPGQLRETRDVLGLIPKNQPPAIWVFVENVKRAIGIAGADGRSLAIAIGRVVAHEMVHSLAPELGHTKNGLMRHALDRDALIGTARPSHLECAAAVRAALKLGSVRAGVPAAAAAVLPFPPLY